MKTIKCLVSAVLLLVTTSAFPVSAIGEEIPIILKSGFDQYAKEGPKAALAAWSKGSAIEGSKEMLSQANNFQQIQDFYGNFTGYNVAKVVQHSASSAVYMIEIKYEKGNVFSKFFTYKKLDGQVVVTTLNFHTNPEAVWPGYLAVGCSDK